MKQLQVLVKDKNTLVLLEDGKSGDLINLAELANVDLSALEEVINNGKDQVYQKKLDEMKKALENQKANELEKLKLQLASEHLLEINGLKQKLNSFETTKKLEIEKIKNEYEASINRLKLDHNDEINKKNDIINKKELLYQELQNRKASLNVKMIGEELEIWCNNEMTSYMQNGFFNCKWYKDNKVVKTSDESFGTKADYIFEVYASNECNEGELLTSVCLDMKDENPNSTYKKKNSEHLDTLNKNRIKKGCKYAVLVSNLELDNPNDIPILKVREYEDMYIVRPAYMLVLLNMIASLTTNFKDLLLQAQKEELEIKSKIDFLEQFEALKKTYLENGLIKLEKNITEIKTKSSSIIKAADDIDNLCNTIINGYMREIQGKLDTFEVKINREYKKI